MHKHLGNSINDILRNIAQGGIVKLVLHTTNHSESVASCSNACDGQSSQKRAKLFSCAAFHEELM